MSEAQITTPPKRCSIQQNVNSHLINVFNVIQVKKATSDRKITPGVYITSLLLLKFIDQKNTSNLFPFQQ